MAMELTCLGLGKGQGDSAGPSCHLLQASGAHLLLECPLDMSVLQLFLPAATLMAPTTSGSHKRAADMDDALPKSSDSPFKPGLGRDTLPTHSRKWQKTGLEDMDGHSNLQKSGLYMDGFTSGLEKDGLPACSTSGLDMDDIARSGKWRKLGVPCVSHILPDAVAGSGPTRVVDGHFFLDVEPWYKTAEFGLLDVSSIDAVLISNPEGMLGLPLLTRMGEFSAKIYATSVTAKLGQLMMEELVSMHAEYVQSFGRSDPSKMPFWLELMTLDELPEIMKKALVDDDGVGRANWHNLYRKKDIETCMKKVQCLHYDEEISIYDFLRVKPCSSGFEIGASNWVISGARRLSYFSASELTSGHAMSLNVASHVSSDVLLFCDLKRHSTEANAVQNPTSEGNKASSLRFSGKEALVTGQEELFGKTRGRHGDFSCGDSTDQLPLVCEAALDAVTSGGSVLVTIRCIGASLELLEVISQTLCTSNLGHIPMFFISPVAEEILVYANTVPEWLCAARQEKLYAGEALFGHVELLQQKRLHHLSAFHSPKSVNLWKEPCVVFVVDWGLRMGPAVSLLHKWRQDPRCLLVLTQTLLNVELALVPFRPITMKILHYNRAGKLQGEEVAAIIEKLKPELSLLPETMKGDFQQFSSDGKEVRSGGNIRFYDTWGVLTIPAPQRVEVDMSAELACHFRPKQLESGIALGHMTMSLQQKDSRWLLELPTRSEVRKASFSLSARDDVCWGSVEIADLVNTLMERGLRCEVRTQTRDDMGGSQSPCKYCIIINSPSPAKVELMPDSTLIETDDPIVRQLVTDAVKSLLHFV